MTGPIGANLGVRMTIPHWTGTSDRSPIRYKTVTVDQDETHVFVVRAT